MRPPPLLLSDPADNNHFLVLLQVEHAGILLAAERAPRLSDVCDVQRHLLVRWRTVSESATTFKLNLSLLFCGSQSGVQGPPGVRQGLPGGPQQKGE